MIIIHDATHDLVYGPSTPNLIELKPVFHLATIVRATRSENKNAHRDWLKLSGEKIRREQVGTVPTFLSVHANKVAKWKTGINTAQVWQLIFTSDLKPVFHLETCSHEQTKT